MDLSYSGTAAANNTFNAIITSLTVADSADNTVNPGAATANPLWVDGSLTFQGAATVNLAANGEVMEKYIGRYGNTLNLTTPGDGATDGQVTRNVSNSGIFDWYRYEDVPICSASMISKKTAPRATTAGGSRGP